MLDDDEEEVVSGRLDAVVVPGDSEGFVPIRNNVEFVTSFFVHSHPVHPNQ